MEREVSRSKLLGQLEEEAALGRKFIEFLRVIERTGGSFFINTGEQYLRFVTLRVPLAAARDAARELADIELSGVLSEGAIRHTADSIARTLRDVIEGVMLLQDPKTQITTHVKIQTATERVERKLRQLSFQLPYVEAEEFSLDVLEAGRGQEEGTKEKEEKGE